MAAYVIKPGHLPEAAGLILHADTLRQEVLCYLERGKGKRQDDSSPHRDRLVSRPGLMS